MRFAAPPYMVGLQAQATKCTVSRRDPLFRKAADISRINGTKIIIGYAQGGAVQAIVDAIQDAFETSGQRRENFGPSLKKKHGNEYTVSGHADHIHLSVN